MCLVLAYVHARWSCRRQTVCSFLWDGGRRDGARDHAALRVACSCRVLAVLPWGTPVCLCACCLGGHLCVCVRVALGDTCVSVCVFVVFGGVQCGTFPWIILQHHINHYHVIIIIVIIIVIILIIVAFDVFVVNNVVPCLVCMANCVCQN